MFSPIILFIVALLASSGAQAQNVINQFTVVEDRNPKGREWLQRLMAER